MEVLPILIFSLPKKRSIVTFPLNVARKTKNQCKRLCLDTMIKVKGVFGLLYLEPNFIKHLIGNMCVN